MHFIFLFLSCHNALLRLRLGLGKTEKKTKKKNLVNVENTCFGRHKNNWKWPDVLQNKTKKTFGFGLCKCDRIFSWVLLKTIQWFHIYKCWPLIRKIYIHFALTNAENVHLYEVTSLAALLPPTPQPPDRDVACFVHMSICYVAYDTNKPQGIFSLQKHDLFKF